MAKITRTQQRRLLASSVAFILMAAVMVPAPSDARGGFGSHGGHAQHRARLGIAPSHFSVSPGISTVRHGFFLSQRNGISHRNGSLRHSHVIGSDLFAFDAGGTWVDNGASTPVVVVTQEPLIMQEAVAARRAVVKTPNAEPQGAIVVVRGGSKTYVTFSPAKPG